MSEGKMEQNQMSEEIILNEMIDRSRMIGDLISPDELLYQYRDANSPGFIPGIEYLSRIYNMRKVRGDGNCFYRAFLFAYLEELLIRYTAEGPEVKQSAIDERQRFLNKIENSKAELVEIGYSEMAIETFHDVRHYA
jgi:ubiquitin thioesterase protein OTUB1